jgi:hypothetical protein
VTLALIGNSPAHDQWSAFWPWLPPLSGVAIGYDHAAIVARSALALLVLAWLGLGLLTRRRSVAPRVLALVSCAWAVPLMTAPPITSNDLYAYAASGRLQAHGIDPYLSGPEALGRIEPVLNTVGHSWTGTASPYGAGFLDLTHLIALLTGRHFILAVALLRLVMVAALAAAVWLPGPSCVCSRSTRSC